MIKMNITAIRKHISDTDVNELQVHAKVVLPVRSYNFYDKTISTE